MASLITVINTTTQIISGAAVSLPPGTTKKISAESFSRSFYGGDGKPTVASSRYFKPAAPGTLPALQVVTLRSIPAVDAQLALEVIAEATTEDMPVLAAILELEDRDVVGAALEKKLKELERQEEERAALEQEEHAKTAKVVGQQHALAAPSTPPVPVQPSEPAVLAEELKLEPPPPSEYKSRRRAAASQE